MPSIYILKSSHTNDVYIGKTKTTLQKRFGKHKSDYQCFLKGQRKRKCSSVKLLCYSDCDIFYLEENVELSMLKHRERYWIENTPNAVNLVIPTQTKKEWREKNKDKVNAQKRAYAQTPKEKARRNKYDEEHKDRIRELDRKRYDVKWTCPYCNTTGCKKYVMRHYRTNKCIKTRNAIRIIKRFISTYKGKSKVNIINQQLPK